MTGVTLMDRQDAVRDLESRLRRALLIARLGGEQLVSRDGRLEILRLLGHGASGVVCEARDRKLGRKVALKLYPGLARESLAQAVRSEAQMLAVLTHRNIVVVHDFDADEFRPGDIRCFLVVMEFLSGKALRHWMAQPHPAVEILEVFCRAGDGLAAAHSRGIIHRDFKPENVMMVEGGEPKLVDFGLAILDSPAAAQLDSREPQQRAIVGTLAYMAPEALQGRMDARSDQFSFAAALWEALCGEFPYPIESIEPRDRATLRPPRPDTGLPVALFECLRRALQPEPHRRFPTMSELVSRLRQLQSELHRTTPIVSVAAVPADLNLPSDTLAAAATATAARVPGRSWAWLAFPVVGAAAVAGVLAQAGFWDSEEPVAAEEPDAAMDIEAVDTGLTAVSAAPAPAPIQAVIPAATCANVAGQWAFDTSVQDADREELRDKIGHYELTLTPGETDCSFTAALRKTGNDKLKYSSPGIAKPKQVMIKPTSAQLAEQFIVKGITYNFTLRFSGDTIDGRYTALDPDHKKFKGGVRGRRIVRESKNPAEP